MGHVQQRKRLRPSSKIARRFRVTRVLSMAANGSCVAKRRKLSGALLVLANHPWMLHTLHKWGISRHHQISLDIDRYHSIQLVNVKNIRSTKVGVEKVQGQPRKNLSTLPGLLFRLGAGISQKDSGTVDHQATPLFHTKISLFIQYHRYHRAHDNTQIPYLIGYKHIESHWNHIDTSVGKSSPPLVHDLRIIVVCTQPVFRRTVSQKQLKKIRRPQP